MGAKILKQVRGVALMNTRFVLFLLMMLALSLPDTAWAQKKYGMFDAGHKFDPPGYVVLVDKQYTQNGVMDDDMYFITSEKVDGDKVFFVGAHSDVKTIGGPFRTIEELAAVLPDKATAWTPDMTRFAAKPAADARRGSGTPATSSNKPLSGNVGVDLSPTQMTEDLGNNRGQTGQGTTGPHRRNRTNFPSLATILFGTDPSDGELKGKVFTINPDGTNNYLIGSFDIINGELRIFPAGGDTIHVMTLQAPEGGVLKTDYVHYTTTSGGGQASVPSEANTRSSGTLDFSLTGGPNVDAMMQQRRSVVSHGPPSSTNTMDDLLAPFPVRFIPDP